MLCASVCWSALKISNRKRRREGVLVGREGCRVRRQEQRRREREAGERHSRGSEEEMGK